MRVLIGSIAYRSAPGLDPSEQLPSRPDEIAKCKKCGEAYVLIEGSDATEEMVQGDVAFLAKILSSSHPCHPPRLLIRDPDGALNRRFHPTPAASAYDFFAGQSRPF